MTGRIERTVFISYCRTNFWTALAVFQNLHANGYDVFFDYKSIPSGDFEQVITENVKSRAHFIVILSPSALERCHEPGDWLRREIETATFHILTPYPGTALHNELRQKTESGHRIGIYMIRAIPSLPQSG